MVDRWQEELTHWTQKLTNKKNAVSNVSLAKLIPNKK